MTELDVPTLATLVVHNPAAAAVLERFGLDYCCGGRRTLADACREAGVDLDAVTGELAAAPPQQEPWSDLPPAALGRHIVEVHHRYLQAELPLLDALAEKVATVHGDRHPELVTVRRLVAAVRADLEPHMLKEERILFPAVEALTEGERDFAFGSIANPIGMMSHEHDRAGWLLADLHEVTGGYAVPDDACASYRSLYERLAALEADTHLHIHKENNVLFPAVVALEAG